MRQLVQNYRTGSLTLEEAPWPALHPAGVQVRNHYSLISPGTERAQLQLAKSSLWQKALLRPERVKEVFRNLKQEGVLATCRKVFDRLDTPIAPGYCSAGVVETVGETVQGFRPGDRVACAGEGHGSHAEMVYVPQTLCAPVPADVPLRHACFAPLGAIALESLRQAEVQLGERIGVIGLGLVGQLIVQLLNSAGCHVLAADPRTGRAQLARELGAENISTPEDMETSVREFTAGQGLDAVILAAASDSNAPIELAGRIARDRGRVVVVGSFPLNIPRQTYYEKELTIRFSRAFGPGTYDPAYSKHGQDYPFTRYRWTAGRHVQEFLALLKTGRVQVEPLITHTFPFEQTLDAYELLSDPATPSLGIVLSYKSDSRLPRGPIILKPKRYPNPNGAVCLGVIGPGKFAQTYLLPHLKHPNIRLRALATATPTTATHVARKFGFEQCGCDAESVLNDPEIDSVLIATRHDLHARLTCAALAANKSVFVEKPLTLSLQELRQVSEAARRSTGLLQVGFNRRFSPMVRRAASFFASRSTPLMMTCKINTQPLRLSHWIHDPIEGGGRIRGEICHFIDLLSFLAGAPPTRVLTEPAGNAASGPGQDDNVIIRLQFADGSDGTIFYTTTGDSSLSREEIEITGNSAGIQIHNFRTMDIRQNGKLRRQRAFRRNLGYRAELDAFFDAIRAGGPAPIPLEDLLASSLATLRAADSLQTGQPVAIELADLDPVHG